MLPAAEHYTVALAVYALRSDAWGLAAEEHGPCGWAAIVRKGEKQAIYRQHSCHSTRAQVNAIARATIETILAGRDFSYLTDGPDLARALTIARQVAIIVDEPQLEIVQ